MLLSGQSEMIVMRRSKDDCDNDVADDCEESGDEDGLIDGGVIWLTLALMRD